MSGDRAFCLAEYVGGPRDGDECVIEVHGVYPPPALHILAHQTPVIAVIASPLSAPAPILRGEYRLASVGHVTWIDPAQWTYAKFDPFVAVAVLLRGRPRTVYEWQGYR